MIGNLHGIEFLSFLRQDVRIEFLGRVGTTVFIEGHQLITTEDGPFHEQRGLAADRLIDGTHLVNIIILGNLILINLQIYISTFEKIDLSVIYQFGRLFTGSVSVIGLIAALAVLVGMIYMLFFKKYQEATRLTRKV